MSEEILFYTLLIILTLLFAARMIEKADKWLTNHYREKSESCYKHIVKLENKLNELTPPREEVRMSNGFLNSGYSMTVKESNIELNVDKLSGSDWLHIETVINGVEYDKITLKSKNMVEQLILMLNQAIKD